MMNNMVIMYGGNSNMFNKCQDCCSVYRSNNIDGYICVLSDPTNVDATSNGSYLADYFGDPNKSINCSILLPTLSVSTLLVDNNNLQAFTQAYYNYLNSNIEVQKLLCNLAITLFEGRSILFYLDEQTDMFENQLFQYLANWGFTIYTADQVLAGQASVSIDSMVAPMIADKIAKITGNRKYANKFSPAPMPQPQPQAIPQQQMVQNPAPTINNIPVQPPVQSIDPMANNIPQPGVQPQQVNPQAILHPNDGTPPVQRMAFTRCNLTPEQRELLYLEKMREFGIAPNMYQQVVMPQQMMAPQYDPNAVPF